MGFHVENWVVACNAKSFAIAFSTFFQEWTDKSFFINVWSFITQEAYDQDQSDISIWHDMCFRDKQYMWKQEHMESFPSTTTVTVSTTTKLSRVVSYHEGTLPIKLHHLLITWSCEIKNIFPLSECPWPPNHSNFQGGNLSWWAHTYNAKWHFNLMVL